MNNKSGLVPAVSFETETTFCSWQIRHRVAGLNEFLESSHDRGAREELAKKIDFAAQFIVGNSLHEFLCGSARYGVKFCDLSSSRARDAESFALTGELRHEADGVRAGCVDRAAGKKQVPH